MPDEPSQNRGSVRDLKPKMADLSNTAYVGRSRRVSYLRGDKLALTVGVLLTLYALGWFFSESIQRMNRDRAIIPAEVGTP